MSLGLKIHFANCWTIEKPDERIREYTEIEVYKGYDDAHSVNNELSLADILAADKLYAQIMRFRRQTAEQIIQSEAIREQLRQVENAELGAISESTWSYARNSVGELLSAFLRTKGVGLAVATKLLHLKRPKLFPILDSYVVSFLLGRKVSNNVAFASSKDVVLRFGMQALEAARRDLVQNARAFDELSESLRDLSIPLEKVRLYDILCWTTEKWNVRKELSAPYATPGRSLLLASHADTPGIP